MQIHNSSVKALHRLPVTLVQHTNIVFYSLKETFSLNIIQAAIMLSPKHNYSNIISRRHVCTVGGAKY